MKTGLVLEGGGMRGIYTVGVLDVLLDNNIHFDYIIGVPPARATPLLTFRVSAAAACG